MVIRATWNFNGQEKIILGNWHRLWCLLFGPFYYAFKGMWWLAILSFFTLNGLWIGFPLFNRSIVLRHFHRQGWVQNLCDQYSTKTVEPPEQHPICHGCMTKMSAICQQRQKE